MHPLILARLYNTPLLLSGSKLEVITQNVTLKLLANIKPEKIEPKVLGSEDQRYTQKDDEQFIAAYKLAKVSNNVSYIKVHGSLTAKIAAGASGTVPYEAIANQIKAAIDSKVKHLIFWISSPGGEVEGCFGLANYIADLPKQFGIKTTAIVDGDACSGGYVLAAACQQILATKESNLGSIAVRATLIDISSMDEKQGIKYTIVQSKDEKVTYNPHEPTTDKVKQSVLDDIMKIDRIMNENVSSHRASVTEDVIKKLNGRTVLAEEGIQLGLADKLISSFNIELQSILDKGENMADNTVSELEKSLIAENTKLKSELEALKVSGNTETTKAIQGERERILKIMDSGKTLGIADTTIRKRIEKGSSVEDATDFFTEIKETMQLNNPSPEASSHTGSHPSISGKTDDNPFEMLMQGQKVLNEMRTQ